LRIRLLPHPHVEVNGVVVGNAAWGSRPSSGSASGSGSEWVSPAVTKAQQYADVIGERNAPRSQ